MVEILINERYNTVKEQGIERWKKIILNYHFSNALYLWLILFFSLCSISAVVFPFGSKNMLSYPKPFSPLSSQYTG